MKRIALSISLILALVLAMSAFSVLGGDGANIASHQITGVLEGSNVFVPFPNAQTIMGIDNLGHASGVVKGLGLTNILTFHRPVLPDYSGVTDGLVKIIAANGDMLQGYYEGGTIVQEQEPPYRVIGDVDFMITGGTGRFENAYGEIHATVYATFMGYEVFEWPATYVLEGTVDY
jgi:hypothetical protein